MGQGQVWTIGVGPARATGRLFVRGALAPVVAILLLLLWPVPAQAGSGNWRTYTTDNGLLSNNVQALAYREDPLAFPPCDFESNPDFEPVRAGRSQLGDGVSG